MGKLNEVRHSSGNIFKRTSVDCTYESKSKNGQCNGQLMEWNGQLMWKSLSIPIYISYLKWGGGKKGVKQLNITIKHVDFSKTIFKGWKWMIRSCAAFLYLGRFAHWRIKIRDALKDSKNSLSNLWNVTWNIFHVIDFSHCCHLDAKIYGVKESRKRQSLLFVTWVCKHSSFCKWISKTSSLWIGMCIPNSLNVWPTTQR